MKLKEVIQLKFWYKFFKSRSGFVDSFALANRLIKLLLLLIPLVIIIIIIIINFY